jgi:hypothetical protein
MLRHDIPTHLDVADKVLFGLTARQALCLLMGLIASYALWTQLPASVPTMIRAVVAALCLCSALLAVLIRPHGRGCEEWVFALVRYATTPRVCLWRPVSAPAQSPAEPLTALQHPGWVALAPAVPRGATPAGSAAMAAAARRPDRVRNHHAGPTEAPR